MESKRLFIEFAVFGDKVIINTNDDDLVILLNELGEEEYSGLCG